jgi:hypothetical protein
VLVLSAGDRPSSDPASIRELPYSEALARGFLSEDHAGTRIEGLMGVISLLSGPYLVVRWPFFSSISESCPSQLWYTEPSGLSRHHHQLYCIDNKCLGMGLMRIIYLLSGPSLIW